MGIKATALAIVAAAVIGYLIGRGDGRDIEAYNYALDRISQLESDNQQLTNQVGKMRQQNASTSLALNKRVEEIDALRKQAKANSRNLSDAGKKNTDWASQPVPDNVANVLRTPSDD